MKPPLDAGAIAFMCPLSRITPRTWFGFPCYAWYHETDNHDFYRNDVADWWMYRAFPAGLIGGLIWWWLS